MTHPAQQQLTLGINEKTQHFVRFQQYADVLLDIETTALAAKTFTYGIPDALADELQAGMLVEVPFAKNPARLGYVIALRPDGPQIARPVARIISPVPLFDMPRLSWLQDLASYTATPLATVITMALPSALLRGKSAKQLELRAPKTERVIKPVSRTAVTARQQAVLDSLWQRFAEGVPLRQLVKEISVTPATLKKMVDAQLVEIQLVPVHSRTTRYLDPCGDLLSDLTDEQSDVVEAFFNNLPGQTTWLEGVTGSGKTQVYIAIAARLIAQGHSVLLLVPEIALTSQLAQRFMATFDEYTLALWHSQLSTTERVDTWWRVFRKEVRLIIGPRSALFLPMQDLAAIIMDEAHDASFKQDTPAPRYDARLEAERLAGYLPECRVLCGSATPDIAHLYKARQVKHVLHLTQRFGARSLADVALIDMRSERHMGQIPVVSHTLVEALAEVVNQKQQAIVLVNRRGFYTQLTCTACEHTLCCPHCTVSLTVHQPTQSVRCHYCGYETPVPQFCPACANFDLRQSGVGTQRVAHTLQEAMPGACILRLDSDVMRHKNGHLPIFRQFAEGKADILVGTQMVAKGLDVGNVTCVGVIGGDSGLNLPDYLASERTFQLLTQVAGRAGRGERPGRVWVQTRLPHHPVIHYARAQDMAGFYEYELSHRQASNFPPYSQLIRLLCSSENETEAQQGIEWVHQQLMVVLEGYTVECLGPAPCVITKIQDRYRYQLLIKNMGGEMARQQIAQWYLGSRFPKTLSCLIDVDCQNLL